MANKVQKCPGPIRFEMQIICSCSQTHFTTSHRNYGHEDIEGIFSNLFLVETHKKLDFCY